MLQNSLALTSAPTPRSFVVHSDQLRSVARAISLPSRSSGTIDLTVSTNEILFRESTADDGFSVAMTIAPIQPTSLSVNEVVSFKIPKQLLASWGHHYDCELSFELHGDQDTLSWQGSGRSFHMRTPVRFVAPKGREENLQHLATLNSRDLCDAIGYAAILIDKRPVNIQVFDGLEISGGTAKSGYLSGISLYRSAALPGALRFVLPKRNVTNARAAIGKMQGAVEVAENEAAVFINSGGTEVCWNKAGHCPPVDQIFTNPTEARFDVTVAEALSSVLIASIASDRGRIVLENFGDNQSLSLLSIAPAARYEAVFKGQFRECNLLPGTILALDINLADLQRVLVSTRTHDVEISIAKHLFIIKSVCAEYEEISALASFT